MVFVKIDNDTYINTKYIVSLKKQDTNDSEGVSQYTVSCFMQYGGTECINFANEIDRLTFIEYILGDGK